MSQGSDRLAAPLQDLVVQKLFEIADRLADQVCKGEFRSKTYTVGTSWVSIDGPWHSVTLYNDGDSDLYVRLEERGPISEYDGLPWQTGEAPLKSGDSISLDAKGKIHNLLGEDGKLIDLGMPKVKMICQTGSASVRTFRFW